jgi:hypothetical protein
VSGCSSVDKCPGLENYDLSHIVEMVTFDVFMQLYALLTTFFCYSQHIDYCRKMKEILECIDLMAA